MSIITAEMNAAVYQLPVSTGAVVQAGETIAVLESMKMEIPVEAPVGGVITFKVAEGDEILEGGVIAEIS